MGKIGDARAVEPFIQCLNGADGFLRKAAKETLEEIKAKRT